MKFVKNINPLDIFPYAALIIILAILIIARCTGFLPLL